MHSINRDFQGRYHSFPYLKVNLKNTFNAEKHGTNTNEAGKYCAGYKHKFIKILLLHPIYHEHNFMGRLFKN